MLVYRKLYQCGYSNVFVSIALKHLKISVIAGVQVSERMCNSRGACHTPDRSSETRPQNPSLAVDSMR